MRPVPLITVIVPVYNVARQVGACIASLRAQTLGDFECLVIDDGSTDGSAAKAIAAFGDDSRFTLVHQENQGLSGARNTGLDAARGAFIAFVDSDDRVMPDYLWHLWRALEDTGCDWVACAVRFALMQGVGRTHSAIHGAGALTGPPLPRRYALDTWEDVVRHFPSAWNKLYRRTLIEGLRFDAGTWFEDHSFFHRAALRTDHLLYLPEPLYLQTQGLDGQITGIDDDRVFEQFDVLTRVRAIMVSSDRPGADTGFARIASRLLFERSTILRDPDRRARFAAASAAFLAREGIAFTPDWDDEIARSWALEMAGTLPLSVVIPWDGRDPALLQDSLRAVAAAHGPGREVMVVCDSRKAARKAGNGNTFGARIVIQHGRGLARARNHGLALARGVYVVFLDAADRPHPWALLNWCETMLRNDADFGLSSFRDGLVQDAPVRSGFIDHALLPGGQTPHGVIDITPMLALTLEPHLSAKIARRAFLQEQRLSFAPGHHSDWAFCLHAALMAGRVVCMNWPGVDISDAPAARQRVLGASGVTDLWRSHAALVRALPRPVAARLPEGWQRRLFARALREQLHFAQSTGRWHRSMTLLGDAAAAVWFRMHLQTGTAAGLDPLIGPRLSALLDPIGLVRRSVAARRIDLLADADAVPGVAEPRQMYYFPLHKRGLVRFQVYLRDVAYANLTFLDDSRARIPFHLSLRRDEGLAVCNNWGAGGWGAERRAPIAIGPTGAEVTVDLTPPHVTVWIDGVRIFRFGRPKLRRRSGFVGLDTIAWLVVQGRIQPRDLLPEAPGPGGLILDGRLQVRVRLGPRDATADMRLCCAHNGVGVDLFAVDGGQSAVALLQGHLWRDLPEGAPLRLELRAPGALPRVLEITRDNMALRLSGLLAKGMTLTDSMLSLTVLEHLRHADLLPRLDPVRREQARTLAAAFGLEPFLTPPETETAEPETAMPDLAATIDPATAALDDAVAQFIRSQRQSPPADPLAMLGSFDLPPDLSRKLFLSLSEHFSMPGQDFDSFARLAKAAGVMDMELPRDRWSVSALLPFLLHDGQIEALTTLMRQLDDPDDGWILTPPLAWVVQRALRVPSMTETARENIVHAFMAFVDKRRADYWDRTHCQELTRAAAALVAYHAWASSRMQHAIVNFCLRAYGLSRLFWQLLEDGDLALPPRLAVARLRFAEIAPDSALKNIDRALGFFERSDCADAPRLRREFLGPSGVAMVDGQVFEAADLVENGTDPAQSVLRHIAFPGSVPVSQEVSDMVARALPDLYAHVPAAPNFELQCRVGAEFAALLKQPDLALQADQRQGLIEGLTTLSSERSRFLGLGVAMAMSVGLGRQPAQADLLADLQTWLIQRRDVFGPEQQESLLCAPALQMPLAALRGSGLDAAAGLLAAFDLPQTDLAAPDTAVVFTNMSGLPVPSPLFDVIVTVFSCEPNLETRIPAMRTGWLSLLEGLGIPFVVVVGNGDGQLRGDVLHLDAPDDYEGLPLKTLATVRWVHDNTRFAHMVKIDDDCFLNAPLFFQSLTYRKFDYYGRKLTRVPGQLDRAWHQKKSSSPRGRMALDKSPEPSSYADGGSAYTLSRRAMAAALTAAESEQGRQLIQMSYMEDKLLGDLLALQGIEVNEEDYRVAIRRRTHRTAIPVASWHNGFFASPTAPVQMVHLDSHHDQARALKHLSEPGLWPRKIWPTYQDVKLGYQSNALELISEDSSVDAARQAEVAVVACMRNEMFMLPHFLDHYRRLGVGAFLIADNLSDDGTREYLAAQSDVALFSVDTDYRLSHYGVAWQQALLAAFRIGKWSIVADADELLVWQEPQRETLPGLLARPEFTRAEAVRLFMLDMYPKGSLADATFAGGDPFTEAGFADRVPFLTSAPMRGPFSNQPAWTSALRHRLIPGARPNLFTAQKLALLRYAPWMHLSEGMHFIGDVQVAERELIFAHFKYNADFRRKAQAEVARRQHFNDAEEYRKYLVLASEGRDVIFDPELSLPWHQSPFVRARLDGFDTL